MLVFPIIEFTLNVYVNFMLSYKTRVKPVFILHRNITGEIYGASQHTAENLKDLLVNLHPIVGGSFLGVQRIH